MTPTAEIICVGTELLLGEILNSNAQYLAQQLAQLGIAHFYQTVVGDNKERLQKVLAIAASRSNLIITTGGLGPTPDDLTTETIAEFFGAPLVEHPEIWADIQQKYAGREITDNNRKQAFLPQGAAVLANPIGSAPGMIWEPRLNLMILTFPGVPSELYPMWEQSAIPVLRSRGWIKETFFSQVLLYWGIAESALAELVSPFFELTNPTVAPYANYGQSRLRITARAETPAAAKALIEPVTTAILKITGEYCYGRDDDTLASVVGNHLKQQRQTLAVAESCTGGWLGEMLTAIPNSSSYFIGGVISYSNTVKSEILGVSDLETHGAVSAEVALQMATGVKKLLKADWGVSITGIAGPSGGSANKPIGLVFIGIATPDGQTEVISYKFNPNRDRQWIRMVSVYSALNQLRKRFVMIW